MGVTRTEREVIDLAIALVDGSDPRLHVRRLIKAGRGTGLSAAAEGAIRKVLTRGVAASLAAGGGAVPPWELSWGADGARGVPLRFGSATLDLVHWLHVAEVHDPVPLVLRAPLGPLDALLAVRGIELLAAAGAPIPAPWRASPWCWLLGGERLAPEGPPPALDWGPVFADGWLVDALPRRLGRVWRQWIRAARAGEVAETIAHGEAQEAVLTGYLAACDRLNRLGFLAGLLPELGAFDAGVWRIERGSASVTAWHRARRARIAAVRAVTAHLGGLERRWRGVGFVDDDYDEAQRGLRTFETAFEAARALAAPVAAAERLEVAEEQPGQGTASSNPST
jgi:hypothetical protein